MADNSMDDVLVYIVLVQQLYRLDAVLLRIQLKIDVMQHSDGAPEIDVLRIVFFCKFAHDL